MGISATGRPGMKLGYNFMWADNQYGLYFGPHFENPQLPSEPKWDPADLPQNWSSARIREPRYQVTKELMGIDGWVDVFPERMHYLRNVLKVEVVRVFLLCNAQNYGTLDASGEYKPPPYLHPRFVWHFKQMLEGAQKAGIQLIPSLLDFGISNPDWTKNRRWPMIYDPNFFPKVFEPLLKISADYRPTIYAWEVMNEPSWMRAKYFPFRVGFNPITWFPSFRKVTEEQLQAFLRRGVALIGQYGFPSTVGHRFYDDMWKYPTGTLPQFHYYPNDVNPINDDPNVIPDALTTGLQTPPFMGEVGCGITQGERWPELYAAGVGEKNTPDRVFERLRLLRRKNYSLAMLWTDGPDETEKHSVDPLKLTTDCELGILRYLDYFNLR